MDSPTADVGRHAEVRALLAGGESDRVEFKSSFRHDMRTGGVNKELSKAVVKTVAGFLNSKGGVLLIGVSDAGDIVGIQRDLESLPRGNLDAFERAVRTLLGVQLGIDVSAAVQLGFAEFDEGVVCVVECMPHAEPVFLQESDSRDFYVRDGNSTKPLDIRTAHVYMSKQWPSDKGIGVDQIKDAVREAIQEVQAVVQPAPPIALDHPPPWVKLSTRRVIDLFLRTLARSRGWQRVHVISPWISTIDTIASMTSAQFLKRAVDDQATIYVVTRPPTDGWHATAVEALGETGRANIAFVEDLHMKLFTARTDMGAFAYMGSANLTQQSLTNREIGLLVSAFSDGKRVFAELDREAALVYRSPQRRLVYQARF